MPTTEQIVDRYIEEETDKLLRTITLLLWTSLVKYTPVDTGRARAGWSIQKDIPSTYNPPPKEVERTRTGRARRLAYRQPRRPSLVKGRLGIYYITNNVEYIEVLDQGRSVRDGQMRGSAQAPVGMTILAINDLFRTLGITRRGGV